MQLKSVNDSRFRCPNCKKAVERDNDNFPFCCDRCRIIDLGRWATGDYRIAGDPAPIPDDSEDYG
ncbi:hypothetical protein Ga0123462_1885 [Mariprofundus ferrinatatus]|uniref:DNA gyrase inhibitor YacG n=1 Tax=Mariprofundus ferrinatatus TaxID=1921087 RepID=A0A2K8L611_9PROT|nr:DNA gyrase inhibitor YacG [Mariprofundus ferrinatatus]ATX82727.1 hypothetical protein Ga0123462_1885 [Mariprofundus ferrinatatus]